MQDAEPAQDWSYEARRIKIHDAVAFDAMRRAGRLAAETLDYITPHVHPGVTTGELDRLFDDLDIIVTPTIPKKAFRLLREPPGLERMAERAAGMCQDTYPTNVTGNPSLSLPCGRGEHGLPIGLQVIGRHFAEATVFRAAHAFEQAGPHG